LSTEIADLEEIMNRKESIENEWLQLQEEEARLNILLPEIWELPSVLGELELVVEYFDNQISSFQAREVISKDGYTELPFMLSAIGSPSSILAIIKALEAFPHLLVIEYLRWSSADLTNVVLEIHFRVHFYSCLEGGINNAASIPLQGS
jgi:Tfp pilus assembly protein PilO